MGLTNVEVVVGRCEDMSEVYRSTHATIVPFARAGVVAEAEGESMARAIDRVRADWERLAAAGRRFAETHGSQSRFVEAHRRLYRELAGSGSRKEGSR